MSRRGSSPGRGRKWLTPLKEKWHALSRSRSPSPQLSQNKKSDGDYDPLTTTQDNSSLPGRTKHEEEPAQSINYGTVNNIATATNVITGPNYGTIVQQTSNESIDFSQLNDLPSHPDISGLLSDYFPQSRVTDEEGIRSWINDGGRSELVLCVLGRAGVGKSTFARYLSEKLRIDKQLAATIFFGFAPPHWGLESVIKVITHQLGRAHPGAVGPISQAIRLYGGSSVPLEVQIEKFILEPIQHLRYPHPLVIVLDALDQWVLHPRLIKALACLAPYASLVRFVVSGRPGLQEKFDSVSSGTHDLSDVSQDIMKDYINNRFDKVHWKLGQKPSEVSITQLVIKASGLFVWTATVCSLLEDEVCCPDPEETLGAILHARRNVGETNIMATLYHSAITLLFPKPEHKEKLRAYLGAALVLQEPLPIAAFATLAGTNVSLVKKICSELSSLQVGQTSTAAPRQVVYPLTTTFHLSFLEYLQSLQTPAHIAFTISPSTHHFQFGRACLEGLQGLLSAPHGSYLSPLQRYAVKYWPTHTALGTPTVTTTSDTDWKATPHSALLQTLTSAQIQEWAQLFLKIVKPSASLDIVPTSATSQLLSDISRVLADAQDVKDIDLMTHVIPIMGMAVRMQHQDAASWYYMGSAYFQHGRSTGLPDSVERAVDACRCANELGHNLGTGNDQAILLSRLGLALSDRYNLTGAREDQDEATQLHQQALLLRPVGHPYRTASLNDVGNSLYGRYVVKGSIEDLEGAIRIHREALSLCPPGDQGRPLALSSLSLALRTRYKHTGSNSDIDESIALQQEGRSYTSENVDHATLLTNLALSLKDRFDQKGNILDFDESTRLHQEALSLRPEGHPNRALSLNNVGCALVFRFELQSSAKDLEQSITMFQEVLTLWLPGHPRRGVALNNLGTAILSRYNVTGSTTDIEDPIQLCQEALSVQPMGHLDRSLTLYSLGLAFLARFRHEENPDDLEEAIGLYRELLSAVPLGQPSRSLALNNLGLCFQERYQLSDSVEDLEDSISPQREAISLQPPGHPKRPRTLQRLGEALFARFERLGRTDDLDESIKSLRESLEINAETNRHVNRPALMNKLAWVLVLRYDFTGSPNDLDESITLARRSLNQTPSREDPNHVNSMDTLAMALRHKVDHLDESLSLSREVLVLEPDEWESHQDLSIILFSCYKHSQNISQLDEAISTCKKALTLCPLRKRSKLEALDAELSEARISI
ncbi:hypothetical protein BKA70DRAFT_1201000 [Coprinopsis sp. MPI-PUGE-AT-0042]|nr:hypothetical protein BKA70DRAFT_1201000 [Coprinopsis sp. MPI-PUGE-AT-0042]